MNSTRHFYRFILGLLLAAGAATGAEYRFEKLGRPFELPPVAVQFTAPAASGKEAAWGVIKSQNYNGFYAVDLKDGKLTFFDMKEFRPQNLVIFRTAGGQVFGYGGLPGHFFRYDPEKNRMQDLGVPSPHTGYVIGYGTGPDGKFYVGSHPHTQLVSLDPATGKLEDHGRIGDGERQKYLLHPTVGDDNIVYCPVGLNVPELWAYDPAKRTKTQILPRELQDNMLERKDYRCVRLQLGFDGRVYGIAGNRYFLCHPDRVEVIDKIPPVGNNIGRLGKNRLRFGDFRSCANQIVNGKLQLFDRRRQPDGELTPELDFAGLNIFSVGPLVGGKLYGGSFPAARTFEFNLAQGIFRDLGQLGEGATQVYSTVEVGGRLFQAAYGLGSLTCFDPRRPVAKGENPHRIAALSRINDQERPQELAVGPDGGVYAVSLPIKSELQGALARIDPDSLTLRTWPSPIKNQSLTFLAPIPATGELLIGSTVHGGSGAIPTEKEAELFLWDVKQEKTVWRGKPVAGAAYYGKLVLGRNGLVCGLGGRENTPETLFLFDPVKRETKLVKPLPFTPWWRGLANRPGPDGRIFGAGPGFLFAVDPESGEATVIARHPSLKTRIFELFLTPEGVLYYGSDTELWRVNLYPDGAKTQ